MRCNKRRSGFGGHEFDERKMWRRPWSTYAMALGILAVVTATGFTANPPEGSVSAVDASSTSWTGVVPTPTPATTPVGAESFTPPSPAGTPFHPTNTEAGWTFTVNQPILVTHVGVWDGPNSPGGSPGDGLIEDHSVRIYNSQGQELLPIAILKSVNPQPLDPDGFRYLTLTDPVILLPGTYTVSASYGSGFDEAGRNGTNTDNTTLVSYGEGAISAPVAHDEDPGIPVPDGSSGSYFGANFKFTPTIPPSPVLAFAGGTPAPPAQQGQRGWGFTVNRPIEITHLGLYDEGGDGLSNQLVVIHDLTGAMIVQLFVSGADPIDDAGFRYRKLFSPLHLTAGSYTISTFYSNGGDPYVTNATFIGTDPRISYNGAALDDGECFFSFGCVPTQRSADKGYFGPNFRITPEPLKDQFLLNVEGNRVEYKQSALRVRVNVEPAESGKDFDVYVYEAVPHATPEPEFPDFVQVYKEGPLVASATHQGGQGEVTYFDPSELGAGPYLVDVYYRSGAEEGGTSAYSGTATVEAIPVPTPGASPSYKTSSDGGTIAFGPSVTVKAPFSSGNGNPHNRTDLEGNNYVGAMRGAPAGTDLWYIDLRPNVEDPDNPGQFIPNPNFDPNTRVPLYRGQPVPNSGAGPSFDGYLALAVAPGTSLAPIGFSELLSGGVTPGNGSDRGQSLSTNDLLHLPFDQNGSPRAVAPQQWEEFLSDSVAYLFYRTFPFDQGDTGEVFVHRSQDGGAQFDGPFNTNVAIGRLGPMDIDRTTGILYGAGSTGNVLVGILGPVSNSSPTSDSYTLYQAVVDPKGVGHALFVTKVADDGVIYGVYSNGEDIFLVSSSDGAKTWSAPVRINKDVTQTNIFPWLETGALGKVGVVWYATANSAPSPGPSASPRQANDNSAEWKVYFAQVTGANSSAPAIEIAEVTKPQHYVHVGNIFDRGYDPLSPEFDFTTTLTNHNLFDYIQISFDPLGAAVVSYTDDHNDYRGSIYIARQVAGPGIGGTLLPGLVDGKAPEGSELAAPMPMPGDPAFPPPQPDPQTGAQVTDFAFDWNELGNDAMDVRTVRYGTTGSAGNASIFAAMTVSNLNSLLGLVNPSDPIVPAWRMSFTAHPPHPGVSQTEAAAGQYSFALSDRGDQFYLEGRLNLLFAEAGPLAILLGLQPFDFVFGVTVRNTDGSLSYYELGPADFGYFNVGLNTIYVQVSLAKLNAALAPGRLPIAHQTTVAGLRGQSLFEPLGVGVHPGETVVDATRGGTEFQVSDPQIQGTTVQFSSGSYSANEADKKVIVVVTRSGDVSGQSSVDFQSSNGTAMVPGDYLENHGTLVFAPGETTKPINIDLVDDSEDEATESFNLSLTDPSGGGTTLGSPAQTIVSVVDNDSPAGPTPTVIRFEQAQYQAGEDDGLALVTVSRSGDLSSTASVAFTTGDDSATAGSDYTTTSGILTFASGETAKLIKVPVLDDMTHEPKEDFTITLSDPAAGVALGSPSQAFVIITDDDAASSPTPTATPAPVVTGAPTPTPTPLPASQTVNLSTRMRVDIGDNAGIGGFIITGSAPKHVVIRAIGPSLTRFGFAADEVLADPALEIHGTGAFGTISNDNWRDSQEAQIKADSLPPTNDLESAVDATLPPGNYTAIVRGMGETSGIALVEIYDLDATNASRLANLSTRALVGTGGNVVIAGFVLGNNNGNDRIVVRGLGPSLASQGLTNILADPTLELRDSNGSLLVANNDWQDDPSQAVELAAAGLAPSNARESAIGATLPPGLYTAILSGLNNGTGIGLVEVYDRGP